MALAHLLAIDFFGEGAAPPEPTGLLAIFRIRYPEFAAVSDETVEYWLTDAELIVTDSWIPADHDPAIMALAAHNMALGGLGSASPVGSLKGVTSFKSGTFSASFSDAAANQSVNGGYNATRYGQQFYIYLRRNRGGPRVTSPGCAPFNDARYPRW